VLVLAGVLAVRPRPLAEQPYPDSQQYADAARHLASGDGYVTTVGVRGEAPAPPRYPPGFSLALAPFAAAGSYPDNVQLGAKAYAAAYVLALAAAAWAVGGPLAAGLATVCAGASPFAAGSAALVLSDALAAAGTLITLLLLAGAPTRGRAAAAGLLSGLLIVVRFAMVWNLLAVLVALRRPHRKWALLLALVPLLGLALHQWRAFGSPLRTGYDGSIQGLRILDVAYAFGGQASDGPWVFPDALRGALMRWACAHPGWAGGPEAHVPAIVAYPATLLGLFWVFAPPLLGALGLLWVLHRRDEPGARFTLVLTAAVVAFHCVYYFAGARFMAAPASLLAVYGAVALATPLRRLSGS
jgi:hypothetical protein